MKRVSGVVKYAIKQQEDAISVANKIFKALTYPFFYQDQELFITTSIGITFYPNDAQI